jgi:hypothetical protein
LPKAISGRLFGFSAKAIMTFSSPTFPSGVVPVPESLCEAQRSNF